ncbi:MAG: cyclase family protein [Acidobacteria bacterium]|jgi:kynurenine formamidase|nr:cyclase family protein [Acidobacteriota bacterium]
MIVSIHINNQNYKIDSTNPLDISIPLNFSGEQPIAYGVERATSKPCEAENLIGDTRRGGSCNFEEYEFIPHCNGTHTECVGHITHERISVHDCLRDAFVPATLISLESESANQTDETYAVNLDAQDKLITKRAIENALKNGSENFLQALIIRTLPNDKSKLTRNYTEMPSPFFSTEAIKFIAEKGIKHLLVDMPSIDRTFDEGKLSNHRVFWNVEPGSFQLSEQSFPDNTITEMIFVPDEIKDGTYLLNLQIAAFAADASPSRPILFKVFD